VPWHPGAVRLFLPFRREVFRSLHSDSADDLNQPVPMVTIALWSDSAAMKQQGNHTVFLVDDCAPIRDRLKELLGQGPVRIVGEAESAASAIRGIIATRPNFVVLDYRLQEGTGLDVLRAAAGIARETVFIVLTNHVSEPLRAACMGAGAQYFLDKSSEFDQLNRIVIDFNARAAERA
jgi:two-component system response regulator DevR